MIENYFLSKCIDIMLFLTHKPTHLLIIGHNKIVLTTPQQIIFTTLHFLEEFISKQLAQQNPSMLHFSQISSEAIVYSNDAIQVYWTDWTRKVQLRCFIALSHQPIYSVVWDKSWKIYGDFRQYSPSKVKLVRIQNYDEDFSSCFLGENQFILTNKRLVSYNHKNKKMNEIEWSRRDEQLSKIRNQGTLQMKAYGACHGWSTLSISNLCILVRDYKVLMSLYHQGKLYVNEDVLMWIGHGKNMFIYQINEKQIIKLGQMETFQGHYLACTLTEERLSLIFYDFKELQIKNIRLVNEDENIEYEVRKKQKQRIKDALKTSIQDPNDNAVNPSFSSNQSKQNVKLNLTGSNMQLALKASIQKFQQQLQKSFQSEKYNEQIQLQSAILNQIDEVRESIKKDNNVPGKDISKIQIIDIDNLDKVEEQMNECEGLFEQGESGFEWQQMESNYEQNLETSDVVIDLRQNDQHAFNQPIQFDFAETPAFNTFENNYNSRWEYTKNQWNIQLSPYKQDEIIEESLSSKNDKEQKNSSSIIGRETDARKYTQILGEIYRKQPQKFDEALEATMDKVIQQNQARIFFADHIRIHNPSLTRDRLLRLYRLIDDCEQNKILMGRALSQFRLEEVPLSCLPIKSEILAIFEKIYSSVYVQDLLGPTLRLIQELIQSYFSKRFTYETFQVEDQTIQLAHPRNLLNILLYLNDTYQMPLQSLFEVYIKKMIQHNQISTLKKIAQSDVCEICGIDRIIFQKVAEITIKEILEESRSKTQLVQDAMVLMSLKSRKFMVEILSLIGYFNQFYIKFKHDNIFNLPIRKNSENVIRQIIENCSPKALSKLSMPFIFQSFGKIEQEKTPTYYLPWHIQVSKYVAEKLFKEQYTKDAVSILFPLTAVLKRSFVAKILIKYLHGKFSNRLACPRQNPTQTINLIFRMILQNPFAELQGDIFCEDESNPEWMKFYLICRQNLSFQCWQLAYILYNDRYLSKELISQSIISQPEYESLMSMISEQQNRNSIRYFEISSRQIQVPLIFEASSHQTNESAEINQSLSPKSEGPRLLLQSSFRYDTKNDVINEQINRSVRYNDTSDTSGDPTMMLIKLSVDRESILTYLRQAYEEYPREKFVIALGLIDRERVQLHNIEIFKSLSNSQITFPFQKFVPFEYFLGEVQFAWTQVKPLIVSQLNDENFWTIYLLIDILYKKSEEMALQFIQRVICYDMNDEWHDSISKMTQNISFTKNQLEQLKQQAQQRNMRMTTKVISQKIIKMKT